MINEKETTKPKWYQAGPFRVYGPYYTENGADKQKFENDIQTAKILDKKLRKLGENYKSKSLISISISDSSNFCVAFKNGKCDEFIQDKATGEYRIDISPSEYQAIISSAKFLLGQITAELNFEKALTNDERDFINKKTDYFEKYDPEINPIRGSPLHKDYSHLFEH